ncbi:MAG: hypothetical protein RL468_2318 [Pseudomonadota bacterium]
MPEHAALKDNVYPAAQPYGPTPAEPAALSAHVRPWVMLGALLLFFLFAYVCAQWVMRTELQKIVVAKESAMLGLMADDEITVQRLSTLAKNEALFVAATPPIQGIGRALAAGGRDPLDGTTQQVWLQRLAAIAQAYVTARPELFQVRLIGLADQGRELMRVEQNQAGQVRVVPPNELQQKGAYGYFKQALGLAPGQVALSPLDLNVEHGQIEMPPRPTLRASVAVRNASNQVFGVVVVNTHAAPLLSNISSTSLAGAVHWVSNAQGHYLVHPQVEQSFAYLLRPQTAKTFGQEFTLRPDGLAELGLVAQAGTQVMRGPGGQEWLMRSSTLLPAQADGQGGLVLHSGIPIKLLQVLAWQDGRAQLLLLWFEGGIVIGLLTFMLLHWRARTGLRSLRGAGLSEEGAAPKPAIALPLLGKQLALPITGNGLLIALSWGVLLPWAWWALLIFVPSTDSISFPFILVLLPVLLASWAGGLAAGLVATGISVVVGFDLATPSTPPLDWRGASLEVFVSAGITMVLGLLITFTQESVRRQGWRLTQANSRLARTVEATQLGFWEYELTNGRVSWSPEVLAFRGLREGEFDGTLAAAVQYTHPEDRERFAATARDARPHEPYAIEFRVLRPDGQIRWLEARGVLEANASGQPLRFVGTEVDITERKLAVARTHNAVILTDAEGRIEWVNEGFTRITGYSSAEALGRKPGTFLQGPGTDPETVRHMSAAIRAGEGFQVELLNYTKAGRSYWLSIEAQPVRDAGGRLTGFLAIETDITERKAAEAELMRTRDVLVQAQQVARLGSFEYFPRTNRLEWSAEEKRIHGLDPDGPSPSFEAVVAMLLPEDRAPTLAHFEQFIRGDGPGAWDYRVVLPDGSVRHMSTQAASEFDQQGELQRVIGTTQDITERKAAEAALWESRKQLRFLADHAPVRIAHLDDQLRYRFVDDQLRYRFVNQPYALFFGHTPSEILRMHPREVLGETAFLTTEPKMKQALAGEAVEFELFLPDTSLGPSFVLVRYQPERDESDKVVGFISASVDMNERKQAEARLQQLLAERTTLLDEVHHRVKNNLQVVSSLLMLQQGSTQNQEAAEQLQLSRDRVAAIAQVHEQLYRTQNFAQVDFGDYLHELLAGLARSSSASEKNIQLQVLGGKVVLTIGEAVPCALLVNELVSNALKHAFPAGRSGRVWVELALGEDGSRTVWVGDDGVGLAPNADAAAPLGQEQGLGLTLVRRLSAQLQGTLERQVTEVGTLWCLRLGRMMEQVNSVSL